MSINDKAAQALGANKELGAWSVELRTNSQNEWLTVRGCRMEKRKSWGAQKSTLWHYVLNQRLDGPEILKGRNLNFNPKPNYP